MHVMSGVQNLFAINTKVRVVRHGIVKTYFLKKKRILSTVLPVEGCHLYKHFYSFTCFVGNIYLHKRFNLL